jgi:hypothetical protein
MEQATKDASAALTDRMNTALDSAKGKVADAQSAFDGFSKTVSDGVSASLNFADAQTASKNSGVNFVVGLQNQVKGIEKYGSDVEKLLGAGLSQDALAAVLAAGGEAGAAIASELVDSGTDVILQTNALVASAKTAAENIGKYSANIWYKEGVANAQSYLDGVQAAFDYAQKGLAGPGLNVADIKGIGAAFDSGMAGPSVSAITSGRSAGDSFGGVGGFFDGFNINITGGISTSAEIGEAVVNAIRAYNRAAGPANIAVA